MVSLFSIVCVAVPVGGTLTVLVSEADGERCVTDSPRVRVLVCRRVSVAADSVCAVSVAVDADIDREPTEAVCV